MPTIGDTVKKQVISVDQFRKEIYFFQQGTGKKMSKDDGKDSGWLLKINIKSDL